MDNLHKGLVGTLVLALIYIIFLQECRSPEKTEIVSIKTTKHETTIDSTWLDTNTFKLIPTIVPQPIYLTAKTDTEAILKALNIDLSISEIKIEDLEQDFIFKYPATYQDIISDDTVSIHYTAKIRGYLDDIKIGYKLLQPFLVERTTLIETEVTKQKKNRNGLYIGLDAGGNKQSFGYFKPEITLSLKRYHYSVGYNIPDKSITAGIKMKIL